MITNYKCANNVWPANLTISKQTWQSTTYAVHVVSNLQAAVCEIVASCIVLVIRGFWLTNDLAVVLSTVAFIALQIIPPQTQQIH